MKFVIASFAFVGLAAAASATPLRDQIVAMDNAMVNAMMKKDMVAITNIIKSGSTADFKYTEGGRSMNMDKMLAGMKGGFAGMVKMKTVKTDMLSIKEKGDTAVGTTNHLLKCDTLGPDKKVHPMVFSGTSIETYRKVGGVWKMSSMSWKNQTTLLDGKKIM